MRYLIFISLLLIPASGSPGSRNKRAGSATVTCLSARPLNESAARRTFVWPCVKSGNTVSSAGYDKAHVAIHFTHANNGTLALTCTNSDDGGTTQNTPQLCPAGTCTGSGVFTTASLSADADVTIEMKISGHTRGKCTIAHGGSPAAADLVTITWTMYTDGG